MLSFFATLFSFYLVFGEYIFDVLFYEENDPNVKTPHEYKKDFNLNKLTNINIPNDIYELSASEFMENYNNNLEDFTLHNAIYYFFESINLKDLHKVKLFHHEKSNSFFLFDNENNLLKSYEIINPNEYYEVLDYYTFQSKKLSIGKNGNLITKILLKNYENNNILDIEYSVLPYTNYDLLINFTQETPPQTYLKWRYKNALYFLYLTNDTKELNFPNVFLNSDKTISYNVKHFNDKEYIIKSFSDTKLNIKTFSEDYKPLITWTKEEYKKNRLRLWSDFIFLFLLLNSLLLFISKTIDKNECK